LTANGLEAKEFIAHVTSRIIVNKASMKIKNAAIREILEKLSDAVAKRAS
jgi:ATP phosphoribosyltransferase